ncbi:cGMP-specific 3',5'-cyclic phosphodiesterase-like isoform X2 [Brevipalpus obovatus]|uniref:cGMP-specific 3',5'-cyclic phosphodiesterase-like isoform X2 n=1 Tax=Brevipalpus obovatus TaxID=246614 RepID=UPI003D9DC18E
MDCDLIPRIEYSMVGKPISEVMNDFLFTNPDYCKNWLVNHVPLDEIRQWVDNMERCSSMCGSGMDVSIDEDVTLIAENRLQSDSQVDKECLCSGTGDPASDDVLLEESYAEMTRRGRNSVTSELFQDIVGGNAKSNRNSTVMSRGGSLSREEMKEQLKNMSEDDLLMELIRDISEELDIDTLCHKILVNVCMLTNSDRGSLFLARGSRDNRYLAPKLFDVTPQSILEDALKAAEQYSKISPIPFGLGIVGHVALHKDIVNLKNAYEDPRFNKEIDSLTGYRTNSIMCLPVLNCGGDVIGVAQCINKLPEGSEFSKQDEQVFQKYLTFCGIGIQNAQLFELSVQEFKRNQLLLSLARSIFEETSSLESLINKIMMKAQGLLQCEKCRVYLIDTDNQDYEEELLDDKTKLTAAIPRREDVSFSCIFESETESDELKKFSYQELVTSMGGEIYAKIAKKVAITGLTSNRNSIKSNDGSVDPDSSRMAQSMKIAKNILSIPILNSKGYVIGVAQMINKTTDEQFSEVDVSTFEAFAIFCGLGIHKMQMYEKAIRLMAKQRVALEVLSYHASSSSEETLRLMSMRVETTQHYNLNSFEFSDFDLTETDTCLATLRMFMEFNLINKFHIPFKVLCRWVLSVKKNYRPVIYHNWRHSFNVTQTMFAILSTSQMSRIMDDLDKLALLVACLCHDLDHRGTTNSFQSKIDSPLATLYSTSTMEHHHFDQCIMILNSEGNNILQALSPEDYRKVINNIENCILSTDLAQYFRKKDRFTQLISAGHADWTGDFKHILAGMLMTACDVSAICKPWSIQKRIAQLLADEFFQQGDMEREKLNAKPIAMMDRECQDEFPAMQIEFIDSICLPIYETLAVCCPELLPLRDGCIENRKKWFELCTESRKEEIT